MDQAIFALVFVPPLAAAMVSILPGGRAGLAASVAGGALSLAASALLFLSGAQGRYGYFYADGLTGVLLVTISSIFLTSVAYSAFYLKRVEGSLLHFRWYYALMDLFAVTMLLAVMVNDLGLIWIFVEATTVTSALLVALERQRTSVEAAWRYTLIVSSGLAASLLSVVLVYLSQGTLQMSELLVDPAARPVVLLLAVGFALVGYGTKAGIAPMHAWLPDAHSEAPSPVSAMFSGILLPTSLYAFYRTFALLRGTQYFAAAQDLAIGFGVLTALVAALIMGHQRNYKRMLAYSSMENMGLILVGFALGGIGAVGALIQVVSHAFAKSSAFYESGNILTVYRTKDMSSVKGMEGRLRYTTYLFLLSCMSVTGAPPFGVFLGEFMILSRVAQTGNVPLLTVLAAIYVYAFVGLNRQAIGMAFGEAREAAPPVREEVLSVLLPAVNLALSLLVGLLLAPGLMGAAGLASLPAATGGFLP
ncbi:MAG: hydrogenase 4 subunit F [Nitrososphaerota archaeon]|nr:hydrogenase 4 subunit F [Nitrososphaerota archaeon]MDG6939276.1 hydrogenase 4 subunit F [Nitrososphaerota archaeon]